MLSVVKRQRQGDLKLRSDWGVPKVGVSQKQAKLNIFTYHLERMECPDLRTDCVFKEKIS